METKVADKRISRWKAGAVDTKMILVIVAIFFMAAILVALTVLVLTLRQNAEKASYVSSLPADQRERIEYATEGVTIVDDADALQRAVDDMMDSARKPIGLYYRNDAFSADGQNFTCLLGNSTSNTLDAFYTIAADETMEDILFVSGLLRPGEALEKISLERPLEPGDHDLNVGISLVDEVDGEQAIDRQMVVKVTFHVGS